MLFFFLSMLFDTSGFYGSFTMAYYSRIWSSYSSRKK